jgi:hypothetical protein
LLVMPYACSMVGGRPLLSRSPEQGHQIIGRREQRPFTACSPVNPGMCRTWTVHRFDIDCDGARVPWVSVVASFAEETVRRAWVKGGRLVLRMPPSWTLEPDDPCASRSTFEDRFGFGRMRRYCADRRAMAPPPVVEMPFGFAPMLGIDGIFVQSSGPVGRPPQPPAVAAWPPEPPARTGRSDVPPNPARSETRQSIEQPEPRPEPPPSGSAAKEPPPKSTPPAKVAAQPPPATAPGPPASAAKKAAPAPDASAIANAPGNPVVPKIINRPETATSEAREQHAASGPKIASTNPDASQPGTVVQPAIGGVNSPQPSPAPPDIERGAQPVTVSLLSVVRNPTTGVIAFAGLAIVLLAAFALARRREHRTGAPQPRDIASISLGGRRISGHLVPRSGDRPLRAGASRASPAPPAPPARPPQRQGTPAWVDRMPQTKAEALQVLGMGVSPGATEAAIKRIVDGLRLSWHPDLAQNETDRQVREFRMKQINAAWDLLKAEHLQHSDV